MSKFVAGKSFVSMAGLPYKADTSMRNASIIVMTSKNELCNVKVDGTWIYFVKRGSTFAEDETLITTVTYITEV